MSQDIEELRKLMRELAIRIKEEQAGLELSDNLPRALIKLLDQADNLFNADNVLRILDEVSKWKSATLNGPTFDVYRAGYQHGRHELNRGTAPLTPEQIEQSFTEALSALTRPGN